MVRSHTDLPIDARGMLVVQPDLRVGTEDEPILDAWGAGDDAAVPDLAAGRAGAVTVPNAQHAVRQGKLLAKNIAATLRGRETKPYVHHSLGAVATLGLNYEQSAKDAAAITKQILEGKNPAEIPVKVYDQGALYVNTTAAQKMGVTIPPQLLTTAAKVYN